MQKRYSKDYISIISIFFLILVTAIIIKFNVRFSHAHVNKFGESQQYFKNTGQKSSNFWQTLSLKTEGNLNKKIISLTSDINDVGYQNLNADELNRLINSFFAYLDQQEYIQKYHFAQNAQNKFNQLIETLINNSPVLIRETDSIYDVLKNYYYFYRLLGKERLNFIKDILINESDIIEPLMHTFYLWFSANNKNPESDLVKPSLEQVYVYAHFFLETFGGRNYLLRRDPKIRKLSAYYCVLIIDQANVEGRNSNGTDIRIHLEITSKDLANQINLVYKNQYLEKLKELRKKYRLTKFDA